MLEQKKTIKAVVDLAIEITNRLTGFATIVLAIAMIIRGVYHDAKIEKKIDEARSEFHSEIAEIKQLILEKMGDKKALWDDEFLQPAQH